MDIVMASDHRGLLLKEKIRCIFQKKGWDISDLGPFNEESVDYPDFAEKVCRKITEGKAQKGILICGTGIGMSIAANKYPGIRAALCCSAKAALLARLHNDAHVLVLSADFTEERELPQILENFFTTVFEGGRHQRRIGKISQWENCCE
ncbi:MAG TPA: ribose 5-phosphate isomerase B [Firmicutes bacterium]|nr:ribose 5-phosphate isomerase B [Bacillota bacterium]